MSFTIVCYPKTSISAKHKGPLIAVWKQFQVIILFRQHSLHLMHRISQYCHQRVCKIGNGSTLFWSYQNTSHKLEISFLIAGLNALYGIPRGYFHWTNVGITPLIAIVWCNNRYWLVLFDLVHINPLLRLLKHAKWRWQKAIIYKIFLQQPKRHTTCNIVTLNNL